MIGKTHDCPWFRRTVGPDTCERMTRIGRGNVVCAKCPHNPKTKEEGRTCR